MISKVETHVNKTLSKVELATRSSQDPFMRTRRGKKGGIQSALKRLREE